MAGYREDFLKIDLASGRVAVTDGGKIVGENDIAADRIGVAVYRDGQEESLTGMACVGLFERHAHGDTVVINGTVDGNRAYVELPQACYAYEGRFSLAIKVSGGGVTSTLRILKGSIVSTTTGAAIDPGSIVPDITELLAQIELMEEATAAAEAAAAKAVRYDTDQELTEAQQERARANIGSASAAYVSFDATELLASDDDWQQGAFTKSGSNAKATSSTTRLIVKKRVDVTAGKTVVFECDGSFKYRAFFSAVSGNIVIGTSYAVVDDGWDDLNTWYQYTREIEVPEGAVSFMVCLANADDSTVTPATRPGFRCYISTIGSVVEEMREAGKAGQAGRGTNWKQGYWGTNGSNNPVSSTTRCYGTRLDLTPGSRYIRIKTGSGMKARVSFWSSPEGGGTYHIDTKSGAEWSENGLLTVVPAEAKIYGVSVANTDDSTIVPADCEDVEIVEYQGLPDLDGMTVSILGDSISTYAGDNASEASDNHKIADGTYTYAGNHCRYPNDAVKAVGDTYWMRLIGAYGLRLGINESWAGSRVSWDGSTEGSDVGADKHIASQTRIGHLGENGEPDIILVNAGTNDIGRGVTPGTFNYENPASYTDEQIAALPVATFADAYRAMLIRIQKSYPRAAVVVMLPNYTTSYYDAEEADQYLEIIKEACDYFGVPWIDMRTTGITLFNTAEYLSDGIHPGIEGMAALAAKVIRFFRANL